MLTRLMIFNSLFLLSSLFSTNAGANDKWVVYYTDDASSQAFLPYELVVLDSHRHPPIAPLVEKKKRILAYLSLGEIERKRSFYTHAKKAGIILQENPNWPGSYFVDLRQKFWVKHIIEEQIPDLLHKGFNGVLIDTLDNAIHLESTNPSKYRGMTNAAKLLVKAIRYHYPNITIMVNRGFEILPDIGDEIDMVLAESIYSQYDFKEKNYRLVDEKTYKNYLKTLHKLKGKFPNLRIYTLNYWDPDDKTTIQAIYKLQRKEGFIPYVSTIGLSNIIQEPFINTEQTRKY